MVFCGCVSLKHFLYIHISQNSIFSPLYASVCCVYILFMRVKAYKRFMEVPFSSPFVFFFFEKAALEKSLNEIKLYFFPTDFHILTWFWSCYSIRKFDEKNNLFFVWISFYTVWVTATLFIIFYFFRKDGGRGKNIKSIFVKL